MTIKGITRTCFGDTFNTNEEIRKMAAAYNQVYYIPWSNGGDLFGVVEDIFILLKFNALWVWSIYSKNSNSLAHSPFYFLIIYKGVAHSNPSLFH